MERASSTVNHALARLRESAGPTQQPSGTILTERRAARVWLAMAELYGPAFAAAYGDSASPLWMAAIGGLTDDQCRAGLTRLAKEGRDYPANLTQFVAACRPPSAGVRHLGRALTEAERVALLPPPEKLAKPEVVDSWIAKLRARLGR
jgi:hypothetical protein